MAAGVGGTFKYMTKMIPTSWQYSQSLSGDKFSLNNEYLDNYFDIIKNMTLAKYNSALLAKEIGKIYNVTIHQHAYKAALEDIHVCKNLTSGNKKLIEMLASRNNYTMVTYPVAYHFDVFQSGQHSLENKIGLLFDIDVKKGDIGRGGGSPTKYMFALLDWTNSNASNAHRLQYNLVGDDLNHNKRLITKKLILMFGSKS